MVKKISVVFALCIVSIFYSCEKKEPVQKEAKVLSKPQKLRGEAKPVLTTGEQDRFHPQSAVESIRKKRLTNMGRLKKYPPVLTPDIQTANKTINRPGVSTINIKLMDFEPLEIPSYPFDYENDLQALKRLYNQHNIGDLLKGKMSELEALLALMVYTYEFLDGGSPPAAETWMTLTGPSAETITKLRIEKGTGGTSEHYSALFCQLSLSFGFNSRFISMHTIDENGELLTHNVCEVFLYTFDKWAVFDPYSRATYYLRDGIPQSALELRNLMIENNYRDITPVSGVGDFTDIISVREKILPRYRYIYMWRMNNILGRSVDSTSIPWQALYETHLVWEDEFAPVEDGCFEKLEKFTNLDNPEYPLKGVRYITHNISDFYWAVNHVIIHFERPADERLCLYFDTITPNFDYFQISIAPLGNDVDSKLEIYKNSKNIIDLTNFESEIIVRSFNKFGFSGAAAQVVLSPYY